MGTILMNAAAGGVDTSAAKSAVEGALTSVGNDMTGIITTVLPIALGIVAAVMVIKFGIKFFRQITGTSK